MKTADEHKKAAEARIGKRIADKYELKSVLGAGGMGAVYEAHHAFTGRTVALKLLHAKVAKVPLAADRFLREARAAAAVQHEAIADVLDAGKEPDGTLYVVFERLQGEDLGAAILGKRMPPPKLIDVAIEVLSGLGAAHAAGIIHRDVKPGNIFVLPDREDGRVRAKLLDFGVARVQPTEQDGRPLTRAGMVVGTPFYMSPEQMCGEQLDHRADLWSTCVVLFVALAGRLPFQSKSYVALVTEMLKVGPPSLAAARPELPKELCEAVTRGLDPKLENRYGSAAELSEALQRARAAFRPKPVPTVEPAPAPPPAAKAPPTREIARPAWESALGDIEDEIERISSEKKKPEEKKPGFFKNPFKRK